MKRFTLGLIATVVFSTIAAAAPEDQENTERHKRPDAAKMFARIDKDSDGKVSLDEFLAARGRRAQSTDAAPADQTERRTAMFKRLDANSDGFVTADEFQAFASKQGHHRNQKPAEQQ